MPKEKLRKAIATVSRLLKILYVVTGIACIIHVILGISTTLTISTAFLYAVFFIQFINIVAIIILRKEEKVNE